MNSVIEKPNAPLPYYADPNRKPFSFLMGEDLVEKHNVAWRVEQAQDEPTNPILEEKYPWESACVFSHGSIMLDPIDGLWKMWYIAVPEHRFSPSAERRLCYAESKDGLNWDRPELDIHSYGEYERTNILLSIESGGPLQHAAVIVHPEAPAENRYEMFILRLPGWECDYREVEGFPLPPGKEPPAKGEFSVGVYRYLSEDGKRWRPWEQVDIGTSDSGWISQQADGTYVMYHKIAIPALPGGMFPYDVAAGVCRIIMRRTSVDGSKWSPAEIVLTPDWQDAHDTQFMDISHLPQKNGSIGLVNVYHLLNQTVDVQFAGTRDGKNWWRPDRRACMSLKPLGEVGGGMIWPMHPLIQHEGRLYVYYAGCEGLHNDYHSTEAVERMQRSEFPFWPNYYQPLTNGKDNFSPIRGNLWYYSSMSRASWEVGRLWALVTASGGKLTGDVLTKVLDTTKDAELTVNVVTVKDGTIEAELVVDGEPIPGFTRADCTPVQGDHHNAPITWKGGSRCPVERAQIRFYIRRARFYGYDFEAAGHAESLNGKAS